MTRIEELEKMARNLEPDSGQRQSISKEADAYVHQFLENLPQMPGYQTGEVNRLKSVEISEEGKPFDELMGILKNEVDKVGINSASGNHMGYIPGGGLWTSAVADMLAASTNRYAGIAYSSPGAVEIENQMIRWMASIIGYPEAAHGNLTSGGSIANLVAIKAARDFHQVNSDNVKKSVIYFTEQVHHCIHKALNTTGLHEAVLRAVPLNENYQMDVCALKEQVQHDVEHGLNPFLVIATAGTTDTGAVDPLDEVANIAEANDMWFHVDAAYGGFFILVGDMKNKFKGIERSHSVVMDPHKTLFVPYGSGVVLIRDREALLTSNAHTAAYMKDAYGLDDIDPADAGPELSRHFRGLRMWLPLHLHGLAPFKAALEEKLLLCRYFYEEIGTMGFETGASPELTVAIFRIPENNGNTLNEQLVKELHKDGRVFFSSTTIGGKLWLRCAIVSFRTHLREIDGALTMIRENALKVVALDWSTNSDKAQSAVRFEILIKET